MDITIKLCIRFPRILSQETLQLLMDELRDILWRLLPEMERIPGQEPVTISWTEPKEI